MPPNRTEIRVKRLGETLHKVIPLLDSAGEIVQYAVKPLMVELKLRDLVQIVVGASILAVPVAFTEEVWNLGERLPNRNIGGLMLLSIVFVGLFVYFNFYRGFLRRYAFEFVKRVAAIYLLSLLCVGAILYLVQQLPLADPGVALKRAIIVAFPASMSAAVSDMLK